MFEGRIQRIERAQEGFRKKVADNTALGAAQYAKGEIKPFRGYNAEQFQRDFESVLELDPASQKRIVTEAVTPLRDIAKKHGIKGVYPNDGDLPPRITLQVSRAQNIKPEDQKALFEDLKTNHYLGVIDNLVTGVEVPLDIIVPGSNIYICTGELDPEGDMNSIFQARKILQRVVARVAEKEGFLNDPENPSKPSLAIRGYDDIIHATLIRFTEIPEQARLEGFVGEVGETLVPHLQEHPVIVRVKGAYHGTSFQYVQTHGGTFAPR